MPDQVQYEMSDNYQRNKRIAQNTIFLYIRMLFVLLVSLYTTRVVLNTLGVIDYGVYNVVAGFVSMFSFINTSMAVGIQRFYNYESGSKQGVSQTTVYNTAIHIQSVIAIITFILLESVALWYINNVMVIPEERLIAANCVFQCSALSLILVIMQVPFSAAIMSRERMGYFAYVGIFDAVIKLGIVIVLPYIPYDRLIFYGFLSLTVSIIDFLLYYIYCRRHFKELYLQKKFHKEQFISMISFSGWNTLDMAAYTLKNQGLNVLLNAFFGPVVNAARGIASQIIGALQGFSVNIVTAFRPQLVESYAENDRQRTLNLMYAMSKFSYVLLYILSVPIVIELNYILNLWLGHEIPDYTVPFTILVLADMVISSLNTPISQTIQAVGRLKEYQIARSIIISSIIPISWIVLKLGASPISVFWVSLVIITINQPISMILLHNVFEYRYSEYVNRVLYPCICFTLALPIIPLAIHNIMDESFTRLCFVCLSTVISAAPIVYFMVLSKAERSMVHIKYKRQ